MEILKVLNMSPENITLKSETKEKLAKVKGQLIIDTKKSVSFGDSIEYLIGASTAPNIVVRLSEEQYEILKTEHGNPTTWLTSKALKELHDLKEKTPS